MNLPDARTWFRFRFKITKYIKGNTSSMYRDNMCCRYCKSGEEETQEHMETCESTTELREGLNLKIEREHIILWRKINRKLFKEYNNVSTIEAELKKAGLYQADNNKAPRRGRSSRIGHNLEKAGTILPDENKETCKLVREVPYQTTEAYRARDILILEEMYTTT